MIRFGIAGYGYWGPNLARNASELGNARVEMIADSSPAALHRAAQRHPAARLTNDAMEMISDPAVDAILIATPVSSHFDLAMAALKAGKHVLVEKPIAESSARAAMLVDEAAKRDRVLQVDHTFVHTPAVQAIKGLIDTGELGDIYYYDSTRVNLGIFQRDVSVIWDLAVHDFAILDHILGAMPMSISASSAGFLADSPENMAHLSVFYDNGTVAHLNVNWLAPVKIRQTLIGGSKQMVIFDDMQTSEKIKIYDRGATAGADPLDRRVSYRLGDMRAPALSSKEAILTELQDFVRCIESGARPITDGESGLRVVQMLEAATLSTRMRGNAVEVEMLRKAS
jgi:predicted dehydrogenase